MKRTPQWLQVAFACLLAIVMLTAGAFADNRDKSSADKTGKQGAAKLSEEDVPAAIKTAFETSYPDADIEQVWMIGTGDNVRYKIKSEDGSVKRTIVYQADGTVTKTKEKLAVDDLPEAARQTISSEFPDADIESAEKIVEGEETTFMVVVDAQDQKTDVILDASGQSIESKPHVESGEESAQQTSGETGY